MDRLKVGIVGGGFMGMAHIDALRRLPNVEVAALCTRSGSKAKAEEAGVGAAFSDYREMMDTLKLDAIHICTPNKTHCEIAEYAMNKGIHVMCEKPMTMTAQEAERLLELAKKKGVVHGVNYHNRFYPVVAEMRSRVTEGELGRIFTVFGGYIQDWLLYDTDYDWRLMAEEGGKTRAVSDIGTHFLDTVSFIVGARLTEVYGDFMIHHPMRKKPKAAGEAAGEVFPVDTEDTAFILARFDNGAMVNGVISHLVSGKKNKLYITVAGEKKALEWSSENLESLYIGMRGEPNQALLKDRALMNEKVGRMISYPAGHMESYNAAFRHCFAEFYSAIQNGDFGSEKYQFATFEDGCIGMRLCDSLYESAKERRWVSV